MVHDLILIRTAFRAVILLAGALPMWAEHMPLTQLDLKLADTLRPPTAPALQKNQSPDRQPIRMGGRVFHGGFSTSGNARLQVELDGRARSLHAWVGVTDDSKEPGPVWFEVVGDGRMLFEGAPLTAGDAPQEVNVPLAGVRTLVLVTQSPDQVAPFTAWADSVIEYEGNAPRAVSPAPEQPYVLTPPPPATPRINGAAVYGARPGNPIVYAVAATGERPMRFSADTLPPGLVLDPATGHMTGAVAERGDYRMMITASNAQGSATREFHLVIGDTLALTPPMGWNSWNCFAEEVTAEDVRLATDAFLKAGLIEHGWSFINIDDYWMMRPVPADPIWPEIARRAKERDIPAWVSRKADDPSLIGPARDGQGRINANARFADMPGLVDYVHARGLKIGIYSSPGPVTCGRCTGSYGHEVEDAVRFAEWGFDYLKYDWCGYRFYAADGSREELMKPYEIMGRALRAQKRDIVYSLCQYGMGNVWEWGKKVDGNAWRTTRDILDSWTSMSGIGFSHHDRAGFAGPGHWNDPDMLVVGQVGWGRKLHPTPLTPDEQYTHISLWSLLAAPLLIGCDLTQLDEFTLNLLTNDEVIAVNQDSLGTAARRVSRQRNLEVWSRSLADGSLAVGLFNRGEITAEVSATWSDLGLEGFQEVRDLWRQRNLGRFDEIFSAQVPRHGVVLLKLIPAVGADRSGLQ